MRVSHGVCSASDAAELVGQSVTVWREGFPPLFGGAEVELIGVSPVGFSVRGVDSEGRRVHTHLAWATRSGGRPNTYVFGLGVES